jgi:hypothetical protein
MLKYIWLIMPASFYPPLYNYVWLLLYYPFTIWLCSLSLPLSFRLCAAKRNVPHYLWQLTYLFVLVLTNLCVKISSKKAKLWVQTQTYTDIDISKTLIHARMIVSEIWLQILSLDYNNKNMTDKWYYYNQRIRGWWQLWRLNECNQYRYHSQAERLRCNETIDDATYFRKPNKRDYTQTTQSVENDSFRIHDN